MAVDFVTVAVRRGLFDILPDHPFRCRVCDVRRPDHGRQADPGAVWAAVMDAPEPWSPFKIRRFVLGSTTHPRVNGTSPRLIITSVS